MTLAAPTAIVAAGGAPRAAPPMPSFASNLYASLEPLAWLDHENDYALAVLCTAIGVMFQEAEDLARDTEDGPGWSMILDLDRCPEAWLPWLAQFVGVVIPAGLPGDQHRAWIQGTDGFRRGTRTAMEAAAAATLTASKTVTFRERWPTPYSLQVVTYQAETPDPALTERALVAQKPAGLVLDYMVQPGADYLSWRDGFATYADLRAGMADYRTARDTPPTE